MVRTTALVFALAISTAATAQADGPAKMVVSQHNGIAIADYPSRARCERAARFLMARWQQSRERSGIQGGISLTPPPLAYCIPG